MNAFSFLSLRYLKLLLSFLKDIFAEHRILNWKYFQNRNIFPFPLASIFLMRNLLSFELVFSYRQHIIILSGLLSKNSFIVFSLHQFAYNMSRWISLSLSCFRFIQLPSFSLPNLESFQLLYFQMFFSGPTLFPLLLEIHLHEYYIYFLIINPQVPETYPFFQSFFFILLDWIILTFILKALAVSSQISYLAHPVHLFSSIAILLSS